MLMNLEAMVASFGLMFIMEMGDKTQLAVLSLTAKTGKATAVFIGATVALAVVTGLGVALGAIVTRYIPGDWVSRTGAVAFIVLGTFILWSARPGAKESEEDEDGHKHRRRLPGPGSSPLGVAAGSFALLFVAEMGDKTQLAVISMTAETGSALSVLLGSILALSLVTLLGVVAGKVVTRFIPVRWLSRAAGLIFVVMGVLSLLTVI